MSIITYFLVMAFMADYSYSYDNPWPPLKRRIFLTQKWEYFPPILQRCYHHRTAKSLIPPRKNKGWKDKR